MPILDRVFSKSSNICGLEFAFTGVAAPSIISGWQPFYNSTFEGADFQQVYASLASIDFGEESVTTAAGISYKQKLTFRFPSIDGFRAERIALMHKVKYVKIYLTNGYPIIIGRNDFNQNALPTVKIKTNQRTAEIEIETQSIFPTGYSPSYGLPGLIPISF